MRGVNFGGFGEFCTILGVNSLDFCPIFVAKFVNFKAVTMTNSAFKEREMKANAENSAFWSAL